MSQMKIYLLSVWLLLPTIIFLSSCSYTNQISQEEMNFKEDDTVSKIQLRDGTVLELSNDLGSNVYLIKDTIVVKLKNDSLRKIPIAEISGYEVDEVNWILSFAAFAGILFLILSVIFGVMTKNAKNNAGVFN